jgi:hypothetical protein
MDKWYLYRNKNGMGIRRNRWSPWLRLKGYRLIDVVKIEAWDEKKNGRVLL